MPTIRQDQTYYRTMEVCRKVGISRATLLRWIKQGILQDVRHKDRNGWRLFTEDDINRIRNEATRISPW